MNAAERRLQDAGVWVEESDVRAPDFALLALVGDTRAAHSQPGDGKTGGGDFLIGGWFDPTPSRPLHAVRCISIAHSTGQRCRRWSVLGYERCVVHSGYGRLNHSVQYRQGVLERARERLLGAPVFVVEDPLAKVTNPDATPAQRLTACLAVLDTVGLTRRSETWVEAHAEGGPGVADLVRERVTRLGASVDSRTK